MCVYIYIYIYISWCHELDFPRSPMREVNELNLGGTPTERSRTVLPRSGAGGTGAMQQNAPRTVLRCLLFRVILALLI